MKENNEKFYFVILGILIFIIVGLWINSSNLKENSNKYNSGKCNEEVDQYKVDYENMKEVAETLILCYQENLPYYDCKKLLNSTNFTPTIQHGEIILVPKDDLS